MSARRFIVPALCLFVIVLALVPVIADDQDRFRAMDREVGARVKPMPDSISTHVNFIANASGFQEVPSVVTQGRGNLRVRLSELGDSLEYRLSYELEGNVRGAHIHVGQAGVNGGAAVALCTNQPPLTAGIPGPPPCPGPSGGTVSGVLFDSDIIGAGNQGVDSIESLLVAMMARVTYVNVHSDIFPGGEVRGQIARLHVSSSGPVIGSDDGSSGDDW